ncbi:hypothetical protein [Acinetobacter sp.]|uniref:hypothetical protein n=1 Tax=Acinetobacter sp. TaxID=472 RepID=UPI0035B4401C
MEIAAHCGGKQLGSAFLEKYQQAYQYWAEANQKVEKLKQLNPYLVDLTIRETAASTAMGHTLETKIELLKQMQAFGFQYILLGALNYAYSEMLEVDDYFLMHISQQQYDKRSFYAFTSMGRTAGAVFCPDPSMLKLHKYGIPNTFLEIALCDDYFILNEQQRRRYLDDLVESIYWIQQANAPGASKVMINIVDGCDAFLQDPQAVCEVLNTLSQHPIEGVSIEDSRGTFMHFQIGAFVSMARIFMPAPLKILVHLHSGNGCENAGVLEALLQGADGVWGGLPKQAATHGHASLAELLANLMRINNPHIARQYQMKRLLPVLRDVEKRLVNDELLDHNASIIGKNAYTLHLSVFEQHPHRPMDLPPERIGGKYSYRICPVVSDTQVIRQRLHDVFGAAEIELSETMLIRMIGQMRKDLNEGVALNYDQPEVLKMLFHKIKDQRFE